MRTLYPSSVAALTGLVALLTGCATRPSPAELAVRRQASELQHTYRPDNRRPALPELRADSPLDDFMRFAALNHPQIEAAFYDWVAAVERTTAERALPDPRLTLSADFGRMLETLMPGLMAEFPGQGKVAARVAVASAEAQAKFHTFETELQRVALTTKRTYQELFFLGEKIRVNRSLLALLGELETNARRQSEAGKAPLAEVLRGQAEVARLAAEIATMEDERTRLRTQFKAALGLRADAPNPPIPNRRETTELAYEADQWLALAFIHNPRLKVMAAEIRMAEASLRAATLARRPDFSAGLEADVKAAPWMWRPSLGVTLPIWRKQITAQIAAGQAGQRAASARLDTEQVALAVEVAENVFRLREADRQLRLVNDTLRPNAERQLALVRAGYLGSQTSFADVLMAQRMLLELELQLLAAQTQRELALTELTLCCLGQNAELTARTTTTGANPP
ncbi:MAG: TolC family protein [Opitutae bacterium]|nr:TolC family protein [Opitutae bacterium]